MRLFNRFLTIILSVGFIPVLPIFIFLVYYHTQGKENIFKYHENIAKLSARSAYENLYQFSMRLSNYDPVVKYYSSEKFVKDVLSNNPDLILAALLDKNGKQISMTSVPFLKKLYDFIDISGELYFQKIKKDRNPIIGDFRMMKDMPVASVVYPLKNGNYIYAIVNLEEIFANIYSQNIGKGGNIYFSSITGQIFGNSQAMPVINYSEIAKLFSKNDGQIKTLSGENESYIGAFARVGDMDLYVLTLQDESYAFRELNLITSTFLFFILSLLTVFYFISMISAAQIANPINRLIEAAKRVSNGDFSRAVKTDSRIREIGNLISTFNSMMAKLNKYQEMQFEKILDEKEKLELLTSLINDGIILCDFTGHPIYINQLAKTLAMEMDKDMDCGIRKLIGNFAKAKNNIKLQSFKNSFFTMSMKVSKPFRENPLVFVIIRDITAEMKLQAVKEDFFRSVAHDIRAPLLNIQGYVKLLSFDNENVKKKEYLKGLEEENQRIFKLVESVLDMARLESGAIKLNLKKVNLKTFFADIVERFRPVIEDKNIKVDIDCDENIQWLLDEELFERVIYNIFSNACKFVSGNGKIAFEAKINEKKELLIKIEDNGPGMSDDKLDKIFNKFTGYDPNSFGLGLSIAKAAVELHNGVIWAESEVGKGSAFFIKLKAKES